jgi:hypothetical protein
MFFLLETFKDMVNYCIAIGLEKKVTSRFGLQDLVYRNLGKFGLHSWYGLSVVEAATAILKNYRKIKKRRQEVKTPQATKLMAKLGNQGYRVVDGKLRLPIKPREFFFISMHKRAAQFLSDTALKLGSVTLTRSMVSMSFSKDVTIAEPKNYVAYDTNERSIDEAGVEESGELTVQSHDISRVSEVRHGYFDRVKRLQAKYSRDRRVARKIQRKWFAN